MSGDNERDLRIAAYLDGAMSEVECAAFERDLETDPDLADTLERLSANDALLREAMALQEVGSVDDAFIARMGLAAADGASTPESIDSLRPAPANDNPPFWQRWSVGAGAAIAASLVLALTFVFPISGSSGFGDALDNTPSGQIASLDNGITISPVLTFEAGDGRFCREFTAAGSDASSSAIACRTRDGWTVEAWSDDAIEIPDSNEIVLAGDDTPSDLDDAYTRLNAKDPLSLEQERQMIQARWSAK